MNTICHKSQMDIVNDIKHTLNVISEEDKLDIDASILMLNFMAEVEYHQQQKNIDRKTLAALIGTSPSYLTQVFRGDKPLNFKTLAKIQKALNIRFEIQTISLPNKQRKNTSKKDYANFS